MRTYSRDGAQVVCTSTKAEWEASQELEPVHFVGHEARGWTEDI